ncbi:hypothetical protein PCAR4_70003 [Paraburkholderia caribensis]|nr:hypothetical protein PCAR4_70003 [Paraburkholderia caribensis]
MIGGEPCGSPDGVGEVCGWVADSVLSVGLGVLWFWLLLFWRWDIRCVFAERVAVVLCLR